MIRYVVIAFIFVVVFTIVYYFLPLENLRQVVQSLITISTVFMAAVLVRLSRGIPTIEWKATALIERENLLNSISQLAKEYIYTIVTAGLVIFTSLSCLIFFPTLLIEKCFAIFHFSIRYYSIIPGLIFGLFGVLIFQIARVLWRDFDIIQLQSQLIMRIGVDEAHQIETKSAKEKVEQMNKTRNGS